ncbi:MAG TPA: DUF3347 domain-containing protein [Aequorivita sp.]|nr:DUF3347 domain-containing protein [Aequorivita sp.]
MKKISILLLALGTTVLFSCKDNAKNAEPEVVTVDNSADSKEVYAVSDIKAEFNDEKIASVFKQYIQVTNTLINTDEAKTANESAKLIAVIEEMGMQVDDSIMKSLVTMAENEDIEVQRKHFEHVNDWMEKTLQGTIASGAIYKQYCPMAFNNKGAYWLSTSKDVLNPYFGDKMLRCGRVDSEIVATK